MTRRLVLLCVLLLVLVSTVGTAAATPVCTGPSKAACGGRTVPEPLTSASFLSYDEYRAALDSLAEEFPGFLTQRELGSSAGGVPLLQFELTNPDSPVPYAERKVIYVAQSIHGNEPGGREGGIRFVEDLLRANDVDTRGLLGQIRLVQSIPNSDGWVSGDTTSGSVGTYSRTNDNGTDLNRQFPWRGFIPENREPVSEPESQAVVEDVRDRRERSEDVAANADIHGMLQDDSAVFAVLSSGEFDIGEQMRQVGIGAAVGNEVDAELDDGAIEALRVATGGEVQPYKLTSSSEFTSLFLAGEQISGGLSGSGFLGDWLSQEGGLDSPSISTVELIFNNRGTSTNQLSYERTIEQIHADSTRAVLRGLIESALVEYETRLAAPTPIGVVDDETTVGGAAPARFFDDLDPFLDQPTRRLGAGDVHAERLAGLASLVITTDAIAEDPAAVAAVRSFAERGGNVVLTDAGLRVAARLYADLDDADAVRQLTSFGNVENGSIDFSHPLVEDVRRNAQHTYEPATLGYDVNVTESPVWTLASAAWEDGGGTTVATTADATSIGERPLGEGTVRVIGGLLPPQTQMNRVLFGLADYAPVDTGYYVFANALDGTIDVTRTPAPPGSDEDPEPEPSPEPSPSASPSTSAEPSPRPTPTPSEGGEDVRRVGAAGRVGTALAVSQVAFDAAETVVLARADTFPDALAASTLAAEVDAPVLLTGSGDLDEGVADELDRLGASRAYLLGGTAALSEQVERDLEAEGIGDHPRLGGAERTATAALVADEVVRLGGAVDQAIVARGFGTEDQDPWADALAASNLAAVGRAPILLSKDAELGDETSEALDRLLGSGGGVVVVAGGTEAVGRGPESELQQDGYTVKRIAGAERYATAVALVEEARRQGLDLEPTLLANGEVFADALVAGPAAAHLGGALLLADPDDLDASAATRDLLEANASTIRTAILVGGPEALSEDVANAVRSAITED